MGSIIVVYRELSARIVSGSGSRADPGALECALVGSVPLAD
jgi:hypothetical protein